MKLFKISRFPALTLRAALCATAAAGLPALAQSVPAQAVAPADATTTALPAIDIAPAPTIAGVTVPPLSPITLTRRDLQSGQVRSSDTAALLNSLAGVSSNSGGGFSSMPVIRGQNEQRLNVLVDGVNIPAACPNDMNSPMSYTDPQTVESVTVITGVAPVSLGGDHIGGTISVDYAAPVFADTGKTLLSGEASGFYRSNGNGFGGALILNAATDTVSISYKGSFTQAQNYTAGGNLGEVRSTEFAKSDHMLSLALQADTGLFELDAGYQNSPYEGFPNQYMDMVSNQSWFVNALYSGTFDWGNLEARANYRTTAHEMNFLSDKGGTANGGMPMNTDTDTAGGAVVAEFLVSKRDIIRVGTEYQYQWLNDYWPPVPGSMMMGPDTFVNINAATRQRWGSFAEWQAAWSPELTTVIGARYDRVWMDTGSVQPYATNMMNMADAMAAAAFNAATHARTDNNWGVSAIATWTPSAAASFEIGYAHANRSPNIYERYSWGRGSMSSRMIGWFGDGNGYVGNLDLKPESADTVSAVAAFNGIGSTAWNLKVAPYYTHVSNYIDVVKLGDLKNMMGMPTGFVQLQFANMAAEFYGVDVTAGLPLWDSKSAGTGRLSATASWLRGNNLDDGGSLYHQMPFNMNVDLVANLGGFEADLNLNWVTEKTRVDATRNEPVTASYALLNLRTAYAWSRFRVSFDVENIFDKGYLLPLGGMSLGDYKATGTLRPLPGKGRSFNFGVGVTF